MITENVLLNFIFWEILCHTGYPTESLGFSQRKIDVDFPFCLLRGNVRGKKIPLVMDCCPEKYPLVILKSKKDATVKS